jgi:hypothetical protein
VSDPDAPVDPHRRAGSDYQIDTGITAAGRGPVGELRAPDPLPTPANARTSMAF